MRIVKPSATVMEHNCTPYEFIEKVGRTCYKSEDKITEGSAEKFVKGLVSRHHMAMLEHETIYLSVAPMFMRYFLEEMSKENEPLKFFNITNDGGINIISGSFRSFYDLFNKKYGDEISAVRFMENRLQEMYPLVFGTAPCHNNLYGEFSLIILSRDEFIKKFEDMPNILFHHLTHTFLFVCDRGVSHEFVRHRPASFAQESTRYCNYSKDKFGNEITVIEPCFWGVESTIHLYKEWFDQCFSAENSYFRLLEMGATPQEARSVLPSSLKTEIIITATESEWQHIVNLRYLGTTGAPHPQIKEVMSYALDDLMKATKGRVNIVDKGSKVMKQTKKPTRNQR